MVKLKRRFVCQSCGTVSPRWQGQCEDCSAWNSLVEEAAPTTFSAKHDLQAGGRAMTLIGLDSDVALPRRTGTGLAEFDRALGGGLVPGSATLIGGDPGIGKSTLLLQVAATLARGGREVIYVSGEEAADQVRLRARRLGLGDAPVKLASATSVRDILTTLGDGPAPALLIIDSIQTMHSDLIEGAPGTVSQVRASAQELIRFAKQGSTALVLVGHVTKDGSLAGPRVLEHMVDTVLELRRRAQPPVSHSARYQEPLRRHGRDRRLRHGRGRADRGCQSVCPVPDPARRADCRGDGLSGARRHATGAGRNPGADRASRQRRDPAPGRGGLGQRAARHDPCSFGGALRPQLLGLRGLSQCGGRLSLVRSGGGPGGGGRPNLRADRATGAARCRDAGRDRAFGRNPVRCAPGDAPARVGETGFRGGLGTQVGERYRRQHDAAAFARLTDLVDQMLGRH